MRSVLRGRGGDAARNCGVARLPVLGSGVISAVPVGSLVAVEKGGEIPGIDDVVVPASQAGGVRAALSECVSWMVMLDATCD